MHQECRTCLYFKAPEKDAPVGFCCRYPPLGTLILGQAPSGMVLPGGRQQAQIQGRPVAYRPPGEYEHDPRKETTA